MAEATPDETRKMLRKGAEAARGRMVTVSADDLIEALDAAEGKQPPPPQPDTIET